MPKNMLFAVIDTTIISKDLSNTELGFYILLKAKAGRRVIDGNQLRLSTTVGKLTTQINWRLGTQPITKMIKKLQQLKLIEIERVHGKTMDIVFLDDEQSLLKNGYFKVYGHSIKAIMDSSNGKQTLNYLGFYAYFRSTIFEQTKTSSVYDKPLAYLVNACKTPESTVRLYLQWFRENEILANFFVRVMRTETNWYNKYIYADMHDCQKLVKYIDDGRYGSVITEVLE